MILLCMMLYFIYLQTVLRYMIVQFYKSSKHAARSSDQSTEARPSLWQHLRAHEQADW